jgi:hypothetical protein
MVKVETRGQRLEKQKAEGRRQTAKPGSPTENLQRRLRNHAAIFGCWLLARRL